MYEAIGDPGQFAYMLLQFDNSDHPDEWDIWELII